MHIKLDSDTLLHVEVKRWHPKSYDGDNPFNDQTTPCTDSENVKNSVQPNGAESDGKQHEGYKRFALNVVT